MTNKMSMAFAFILGTAVGAVATWKYAKTKYEQIAQEEIDSVKEVFSRGCAENYSEKEVFENDQEAPAEKAKRAIEKPGLVEYSELLSQKGYADYSNKEYSRPQKEEPIKPSDRPYVITPKDFGDYDDYEAIGLTYYADNVLTDDGDEPIDDVESVVGEESLQHIGEYEDNCVHVRNDRLRCDYEILVDQRKYSEVVQEKPFEE